MEIKYFTTDAFGGTCLFSITSPYRKYTPDPCPLTDQFTHFFPKKYPILIMLTCFQVIDSRLGLNLGNSLYVFISIVSVSSVPTFVFWQYMPDIYVFFPLSVASLFDHKSNNSKVIFVILF